jgi:O-antigen/teichoic acid export membrane protein
LRIGGGMLFLGALTGAQSGGLAGFEAFKRIALVSFVSGVASFPLLVAGTILGGLQGAVWGLVAGAAVNWVLNRTALRKEAALASVPFGLKGCGREWVTLWKFSLPAALSGVIVAPIYWATNSVLVNRANGYAEMGIFNAANQWFGALLFLPAVFGQVVLPALSERLGDEDRARAAKMVSLTIKLNLLVVTPLVLILCLVSPWVMGFYGHSFRAGWPTFVIVVVTADLLAVQLPVSQLIAASGRMWLGLSMNLGWALVFVLLTAAWVSNGATGLAAARLTAYAAHSLWTFGWARHALQANSARPFRPS